MRVRVKLGSRARRLHVAGSFDNQVRQALGRPPNWRGELPEETSIFAYPLSVAFIRVDIDSGPIHVVLTYMHRSGTKESSGGPTKRSMQKAEYGLRRILLPRTWVNKG